MNNKLILRYVSREIFGLTGMGAALFWPAGTLCWLPAWGSILVMAAWSAGMFFILLRKHPGLLEYRLGPRRQAPAWDTLIVSLMGMSQLARCIIAGLDHRYAWTTPIHPGIQVLGLLIGAGGYLVFFFAAAANPFFSQVYRIQTEREHRTIDTGPYRIIRHPAYLGALLFEASLPLLFSSKAVILPCLAFCVLIVIRTCIEDRKLQKELDGYAQYCARTTYRIFPGLW